MKINRELTKKEINSIMGIMRGMAKKANTTATEIETVRTSTDFTETAKQSKIDDLYNGYKSSCVDDYAKIRASFEIIKELEKENQEAFDITDTDLINAINIINLTGGELPDTVYNKILESFRGDSISLKILQKLPNIRWDIKQNEFNKYSVDIEDVITKLDTAAYMMSHSITDFFSSSERFCDELISTGEILGIEFTETEKSLNDTSSNGTTV